MTAIANHSQRARRPAPSGSFRNRWRTGHQPAAKAAYTTNLQTCRPLRWASAHCRTEDEAVRIHLPIELAERIEGQRTATAVELSDAWMSRSGRAAPDGRQVGDMLNQHELGVPLQRPRLVGIEVAGQPAQVAVECSHLILRPHRLDTGTGQGVGQVVAAQLLLLLVFAPDIESYAALVELVLTPDQLTGVLDGLTGKGRGLVVADGFLVQVVEVGFERVLGRGWRASRSCAAWPQFVMGPTVPPQPPRSRG